MEQRNRAHILLDNALGPLALSLLRDDVIEVYCNSNDLHVWIEYVGVGRVKTDIVLKAEDRRKIIETVASFSKTIATKNQPLISAELPKYGYRLKAACQIYLFCLLLTFANLQMLFLLLMITFRKEL